jgi:hypothetical protein
LLTLPVFFISASKPPSPGSRSYCLCYPKQASFEPCRKIDAVIDWKSDVDPDPALVELYRGQVRDYLAATKAPRGLIVFLTSSRIEKVAPKL